jgi:hypothetical protein
MNKLGVSAEEKKIQQQHNKTQKSPQNSNRAKLCICWIANVR